MTFEEIRKKVQMYADVENSDIAEVEKIKDLINDGYMEIAKYDLISETTLLSVTGGIADLPNDMYHNKPYKIIDKVNKLNIKDYEIVGNKIYFPNIQNPSNDYDVEMEIIYYKIPSNLINDTDIPLIRLQYHNLIVKYVVFTYMEINYQGDNEIAKRFRNEYYQEINNIEPQNKKRIARVGGVIA